MDILTKVLGIKTEYEPWNKKEYLPLYISDSYDFQGVNLDGHRCILISPIEDAASIPTLKKQIARIQDVDYVPVIVFQKTISSYRRKNMIEKRLPFITENQVYLPFMGTYLEKQTKEIKTVKRFMASTQLLLLLYLYSNETKLYISEATRTLPFTPMTMSRAVKQLEAVDLFNVTKDGVNKVIEGRYGKRELYEKSKPYMVNPVLYRRYIEKKYVTDDMVLAGISALAEQTMLIDNRFRTYAVNGKKYDKSVLTDEMVEPGSQVALEIWNYDPKLFANDNVADPVSVALSFENSNDERIEEAVDDMMGNVFGEE